MPPCPSSRMTRKGPARSGGTPALGDGSSSSTAARCAAGALRKSFERSHAASSVRTRPRSATSPAEACSMKAARSSGSTSRAASKIASTCRKRSRDAGSISGYRLVVQLGVQPAPRLGPIAPRRSESDTECFRGLLFAHPAEETTFHDARLSLVELTEAVQRLVEGDDEVCPFVGGQVDRLEWHTRLLAATLESPTASCAIDEDPPHRDRGDAEEVRAPLPLDARLIDQLEVRLVDELRGAERPAGGLAREV